MFSFILTSLLSGTVLCAPRQSQHEAQTHLVYEYPQAVGWLENIAVRSNGELLMTSLGVPGSLNVLNPLASSPTPKQITGFEYTDTLGIVETDPDVFHVIAANFSLETVSIQPGTNTIWRVDFSKDNHPTPEKVATLKDAVFLNGLTAFNNSILLAADSALGVVWATDLKTGDSWIAADDPLMKPVQGQSYVEGINGLHFRPSKQKHKELCFTNSQQYIFGCIEFDSNAEARGAARLAGRPQSEKGFADINWDDFAFDKHGTAFAATEKGNSVQAVTSDGRAFVVAGDLNSTLIATPAATAFGRTAQDSGVLYAVTAGGLAFPVIINGTKNRTGAQVVAINVSRHAW
ncbi:hypothetical protein AMS68_004149 [Peltaster fructicola]|uniref:SMP-30/Gluconolactonase/LRE-like region domain-containing protein n=1 Tax=Peltaster fructicola TaxID=286661 RepID=A0A6H0XV45_9PEZI|nr:hypothetical protein AMS68_004149 [Peltaster fructicola]